MINFIVIKLLQLLTCIKDMHIIIPQLLSSTSSHNVEFFTSYCTGVITSETIHLTQYRDPGLGTEPITEL